MDKTGSGTLTLANTNNTYAGGTTINGGTLNIAGDGAFGAASGGITFTGNATLQAGGPVALNALRTLAINNAATATFDTQANVVSVAGPITGNGGLTKVGAGTLTLTASNGYALATTLRTGLLVAGNSQALGLTSAPLTLNGGTLDLATDSSISPYNATVNSNVTILSDQATAASSGITHTLGTLSLGAYTLSVAAGPNVSGSNAGLTFGNVTLSGAATINTAAGVQTAVGPVSGGQQLTINGGGGLTMNAAGNAFTNLYANGGGLTIANPAATLTAGYLGVGFGAAGSMNVSAGSIAATIFTIGTNAGGNGVFNQSGGTITSSGGYFTTCNGNANGSAIYRMSGGVFTEANDFTVNEGSSGTCSILQTGGAITAGDGNVLIGRYASGGKGAYAISGGTFNAVAGNLNVGSGHSGELDVGGTACVILARRLRPPPCKLTDRTAARASSTRAAAPSPSNRHRPTAFGWTEITLRSTISTAAR